MATQPSSAAQIMTVDVLAAKDLIGCGYRFLDVRTEEEFKKGHVDVENCLNIPYMFNTADGRVKNPKFMEQVLSVCNKDEPLIVNWADKVGSELEQNGENNIITGCQSGVRSVYATTDLLSADFKHAYNMGGGYLSWVENGYATAKPDPK